MSTPPRPFDVVVDALGVPVTIPANAVLAARLRRQWSRALTDRPGETSIDMTGFSSDDEVAFDYAVTSRVTMAALTETAGRRLNIHAGAVADASGRALAVIGGSGSGKTTAISHLARRLGYLTDETVSIGNDLLIHPHPKPLSVIEDRGAPHRKASLSPDDLGLITPSSPAHLHRIVILHRDDDNDGLRPLRAPQAIVEIVAQTSSLALLDEPIQRLADTLAACGGAWALHYTEIEEWLDALVELLDQVPGPSSASIHHPCVEQVTLATAQGAWSRTPWQDAVQFDDEVVLMVENTAHLLTGLGAYTWLALASPETPDTLTRDAQEDLGEHPDAFALVSSALEELAERGLLIPPA